jgi:hypothetical protein
LGLLALPAWSLGEQPVPLPTAVGPSDASNGADTTGKHLASDLTNSFSGNPSGSVSKKVVPDTEIDDLKAILRLLLPTQCQDGLQDTPISRKLCATCHSSLTAEEDARKEAPVAAVDPSSIRQIEQTIREIHRQREERSATAKSGDPILDSGDPHFQQIVLESGNRSYLLSRDAKGVSLIAMADGSKWLWRCLISSGQSGQGYWIIEESPNKQRIVISRTSTEDGAVATFQIDSKTGKLVSQLLGPRAKVGSAFVATSKGQITEKRPEQAALRANELTDLAVKYLDALGELELARHRFTNGQRGSDPDPQLEEARIALDSAEKKRRLVGIALNDASQEIQDSIRATKSQLNGLEPLVKLGYAPHTELEALQAQLRLEEAKSNRLHALVPLESWPVRIVTRPNEEDAEKYEKYEPIK